MKCQSTIEMATELNALRCKKYPGTRKEGKINILKIVNSYNSNNYMLLDNLIWDLYGLYHREYVMFIPGIGVTIDAVKMDSAIETALNNYRRV